MALKMGLVGRKIGMIQYFHPDGTALGCTALTLGPNTVVAKRTPDKHGYSAVQLGFDEHVNEKKIAKLAKPMLGYFKTAGIAKPLRVLREVRLDAPDADKLEVGKVLRAADVFKEGDVVDIVGTTKGKGYQGVIKRHKMAGFVNGHGSHEFFRHGGSIGCRQTPGRVHKGKRMTGHMGHERHTEADLVVVKVLDNDVVLVKGPVPGPAGGLIMLKGSAKDVAKFVTRREQKEIESKNPMKASKKGAAAAKSAGKK